MTLIFGEAWASPLALVAVAVAGLGVLIERWLFLAEAKQVVALFYGARAARARPAGLDS